MKKVTMTFEFEDEDFDEFLEGEDVQGNLRDWVFGDICQNQGFGFLADLSVENV